MTDVFWFVSGLWLVAAAMLWLVPKKPRVKVIALPEADTSVTNTVKDRRTFPDAERRGLARCMKAEPSRRGAVLEVKSGGFGKLLGSQGNVQRTQPSDGLGDDAAPGGLGDRTVVDTTHRRARTEAPAPFLCNAESPKHPDCRCQRLVNHPGNHETQAPVSPIVRLPCKLACPKWLSGHWVEWHMGHGCDKDVTTTSLVWWPNLDKCDDRVSL